VASGRNGGGDRRQEKLRQQGPGERHAEAPEQAHEEVLRATEVRTTEDHYVASDQRGQQRGDKAARQAEGGDLEADALSRPTTGVVASAGFEPRDSAQS
jgi:hypothetical protein